MSRLSPLSDILHKPIFALLLLLFERILCTPASSAPVDRAFLQRGLLVRPHCARMSDKLLESRGASNVTDIGLTTEGAYDDLRMNLLM